MTCRGEICSCSCWGALGYFDVLGVFLCVCQVPVHLSLHRCLTSARVCVCVSYHPLSLSRCVVHSAIITLVGIYILTNRTPQDNHGAPSGGGLAACADKEYGAHSPKPNQDDDRGSVGGKSTPTHFGRTRTQSLDVSMGFVSIAMATPAGTVSDNQVMRASLLEEAGDVETQWGPLSLPPVAEAEESKGAGSRASVDTSSSPCSVSPPPRRAMPKSSVAGGKGASAGKVTTQMRNGAVNGHSTVDGGRSDVVVESTTSEGGAPAGSSVPPHRVAPVADGSTSGDRGGGEDVAVPTRVPSGDATDGSLGGESSGAPEACVPESPPAVGVSVPSCPPCSSEITPVSVSQPSEAAIGAVPPLSYAAVVASGNGDSGQSASNTISNSTKGVASNPFDSDTEDDFDDAWNSLAGKQ